MTSRPRDHAEHIMRFTCGWCGAQPGEPCVRRRRWSVTTFEWKSYPMTDFHMRRTRLAYPDDYDIDSTNR